MTMHDVRPPRMAVWLIGLFALPEEAESILGDLLEEFSLLASKSGEPCARRWYWRQTLKTVPRLAGAGVRTSLWLTGAAVVGGFLLRRLLGKLVGRAMFAVLERYLDFFAHHVNVYLFLASTGIDIAHLMTFLMIGFAVALVARRNEMVATIALAFIFWAMAVVGSVYALIRDGDGALLWRLTWYFSDSLAIVVAGAIVRTRRLNVTSRPFTA